MQRRLFQTRTQVGKGFYFFRDSFGFDPGYTGYEVADKCAWISSGQGAATNIALATGSFPVQGTWANDFNGGRGGCETTHA